MLNYSEGLFVLLVRFVGTLATKPRNVLVKKTRMLKWDTICCTMRHVGQSKASQERLYRPEWSKSTRSVPGAQNGPSLSTKTVQIDRKRPGRPKRSKPPETVPGDQNGPRRLKWSQVTISVLGNQREFREGSIPRILSNWQLFGILSGTNLEL